MARYLLHYGVMSVHGFQTFAVEASSKEAAIAKHENGESTFVEEDVEVQSLESIPDLVEIDPFSDRDVEEEHE